MIHSGYLDHRCYNGEETINYGCSCGCCCRRHTSSDCPYRYNCSNCCHSCYYPIPGPMGPTGPMGPIGPMGPAGSTGSTGPAGASASLGGIQLQMIGGRGEIIGRNEDIVFDTAINDQSSDISYNPITGEFTMMKAGNYFVSWWVATDGSDMNNILQFTIHSNTFDNAVGATPLVTGQVTGTALVTVKSVPTILTLRNASVNQVTLAATPIQANIVILQVSL